MPTSDPIDFDITVDAYNLARVWLSTAIAQGDDKATDPVLDSTTLIELHSGGIRLVSTDGFILIAGWVPEDGTDHPEPPLTHRPITTVVARDTEGRAAALLSYLKKATNGQPEGKTEPISVHLHTTNATPGAQATLVGLEQTKLVIQIPDERLVLDTTEAPFPDWRHLFRGHVAGDVFQSRWSPLSMLRIGQLSKFWGNRTLRVTFGGPNAPILVDIGCDEGVFVPVRCIAMPVRDHTDDPPPAPEPDPTRPTLVIVPPVSRTSARASSITADDTVVRPIRSRKGKATK